VHIVVGKMGLRRARAAAIVLRRWALLRFAASTGDSHGAGSGGLWLSVFFMCRSSCLYAFAVQPALALTGTFPAAGARVGSHRRALDLAGTLHAAERRIPVLVKRVVGTWCC